VLASDNAFWGMASYFGFGLDFIVAMLFIASIFGCKGIEAQAGRCSGRRSGKSGSAASYTFSIYLFHYSV